MIEQDHPTWGSYLALFDSQPNLSAAGLAQILMVEVGVHTDTDYARLMETTLLNMGLPP